MAGEGTDLRADIKYAKLVKWENDAQGNARKDRPPLEIQEKFGENEPFKVTYRRPDYAPD